MPEVVVCRLDDMAQGSARRLEIPGYRICVVRCDDDVYAIGDRCSHADVSLAEGEVSCEAGTIECWKHGSTFGLVTGQPTSLPATRPVPVYEAEVRDGQIVVMLP